MMARIQAAGLCAALVSSLAPTAFAGDNLFIAGGQIGGQNSSYGLAGVITPLPGNSLGNGWVGQVVAEVLTYRYKSGAATIDALALGTSLSVGYQKGDADGWWGAYVGPSYRHTDLSPNDPSNASQGGIVSARLQLQGEHHLLQNVKANAIVSYEAFSTNAYWTRLRALYRISGDMYIGPEGVLQGDDSYKGYAAGIALVGIQFGNQISLGFNVGMSKIQGVDAAPYGGLELGASF